jgi:hypothetical protein
MPTKNADFRLFLMEIPEGHPALIAEKARHRGKSPELSGSKRKDRMIALLPLDSLRSQKNAERAKRQHEF